MAVLVGKSWTGRCGGWKLAWRGALASCGSNEWADESRKLQAFPAVLATVVVHGETLAGGSVIMAEAPRLAIDVSVYAAVL